MSILFLGKPEQLPNYNETDTVLFEFGDPAILERLVKWAGPSPATNNLHADLQSHVYTEYGSYNLKITLMNNVSQLAISRVIEVEECVRGFEVRYDNSRWVYKKLSIPIEKNSTEIKRLL